MTTAEEAPLAAPYVYIFFWGGGILVDNSTWLPLNFLTPFEPFLNISVAKCLHFTDHRLRTKVGPFCCDIGPFLCRSGIIWGPLRDHFGIILTSFGVVLVSF